MAHVSVVSTRSVNRIDMKRLRPFFGGEGSKKYVLELEIVLFHSRQASCELVYFFPVTSLDRVFSANNVKEKEGESQALLLEQDEVKETSI